MNIDLFNIKKLSKDIFKYIIMIIISLNDFHWKLIKILFSLLFIKFIFSSNCYNTGYPETFFQCNVLIISKNCNSNFSFKHFLSSKKGIVFLPS